MTSMLAHRGWDVYLLPRVDGEGQSVSPNHAASWEEAVGAAAAVAGGLGEKLIVMGADAGASIALAAAARVRPLALALFAPVEPSGAGRAYQSAQGFFERRRARADAQLAAAPAAIAKQAHRETDAAPEPASFIHELAGGRPYQRPAEHPPAIVFAPADDPLVTREAALAFAASAYAKTAKSAVRGRFWPSSNWEPIADEVHRFLILTLADRVVEFPDEILDS